MTHTLAILMNSEYYNSTGSSCCTCMLGTKGVYVFCCEALNTWERPDGPLLMHILAL